MKVQTMTDHVVELEESERWDHTVTPPPAGRQAGITVHVEQIHIRHSYSIAGDTAVWFVGRRRLLNGDLSIQDPHYIWAKVEDIPDARWRDLKAAGAL